MEIKTLHLGHIRTNCYLVLTDSAAVVIDPGFKSKEIEEFLIKNSGKERLIILTHSHFDHIGAAPELRRNTGTKIAIGEKDNVNLSNTRTNLSDRFHAHVEPFFADILLSDGEKLRVGDIEFEIIYTPGHTVGGICLLCGDILFSGDTLFLRSVGRTDFEGGSFEVLSESLGRLMQLDDGIRVLSGHGDETTIAYEKLYNPFINF